MYGTPQFAQRRQGTYYLGAPLSRRRHRRLHRFSNLGALTADQATEQVFPAAQVKNSAGHNQSVRAQILASVQAGQIIGANGTLDYIPGTSECSASGVSASQVTLTSIATVAGKIAPMTGPAAPFVLIGAGIAGLFSAILGHHAAAVRKEQSVLCSAVPAANNYLNLIDQAVQTGQSSPTDGINALNSLLSDFKATVQSIMQGSSPTSSGQCNAACVEYSKLRAIVISKTSVYQDLAAQQAASPVSPAVSSALAPVTNLVQSAQAAVASAGLPSWLLPAAGFFVLWEVL